MSWTKVETAIYDGCDMFVSLPSWLLVNAITGARLVPKTHPWRGRWFTLRDWTQHSTQLTREFNLVAWVSAVCIAFVLHHMSHP